MNKPCSAVADSIPPPICKMNFPSFENFTRRLLPPRCPSVTQISPLGATSTCEGPLKCVSSSPGTAASPRVIKISPSGLNL
ncbi:hypothetical protein N9X63_03955 [Woeseiaceae bacterium]|nr:hypothetical protein [Woeseiaceae bacterium]